MKKILIITYYWPPSGGGGVQRWLKFVKYLPSQGWKPIVVIPENPEYPVVDSSLESDVPVDVEIIKLPIWEPYGIFKKLTGRRKEEKVNTGLLFDEKKQTFFTKLSLWIRGNLLIPDPRIFWVNPSARRLIQLIPDLNPDMLITTGTPHSTHLIGEKIKRRFSKLPWLVDLRDPWSDLDMLDRFYASQWAKRRQQKLEHRVLSLADVVTTVSMSWAKELRKTLSTPVHCITNGFDAKDFDQYTYRKGNNFVISHVGIINSYRNSEHLWAALEELCSDLYGFKEKLRLCIIGITDDGLGKSFSKFPQLKERTIVTGYIPHNKVIEQYQKAACLLLLLNNSKNSQGHIPGKFFEYLASRKPILAIAPDGSDVANIIRENKIGYACPFDEKNIIKEAILNIYEGKIKQAKTDAIESFSRRSLTVKLSNLLTETIEKSKS